MKTLFLKSNQVDQSSYDTLRNSKGNALTIGNFDGVHLGHQAMLKQLQNTAETLNLTTMVMIFEPQPREYFAQLNGTPDVVPARLTSVNEKLALLSQFGIDIVVIATFDTAFRSLSAKQFADMLVKQLNVEVLVLGDDFKFGNDRSGDSEFLRQQGLAVTNLATITDQHAPSSQTTDTTSQLTAGVLTNPDNASTTAEHNVNRTDNRISSTRIRELLQQGDLITANRLLGHDYSMTGLVIQGDAIGRTLGFPTANITLNRLRPALHGVYGVDVVVLKDSDDVNGNIDPNAFTNLLTFDSQTSSEKRGIKGLRPHSLFGTANIGIRPSVDKPHDWRLEVFFPEFTGNLYGKTLNVRFLHYLHAERNYDGLEALKQGIAQDVIDLIAWRQNRGF